MPTQSPQKDKRSIQMEKDREHEKERLRADRVARNARKQARREVEQMKKLAGRSKKPALSESGENQTYVN